MHFLPIPIKTSQIHQGHFVAEVKHVYYAGFRIYLSSAYNFMIYCILSLYIASYTLRIIVYGWVQDADAAVNASKIIEDLIRNNESSKVKSMVAEWKSTQPGHISYFIEAFLFEDISFKSISFKDQLDTTTFFNIRRDGLSELILCQKPPKASNLKQTIAYGLVEKRKKKRKKYWSTAKSELVDSMVIGAHRVK
ncbi:hypothetical protein ACTXT7_005021 [Hymenolepis weldensis]